MLVVSYIQITSGRGNSVYRTSEVTFYVLVKFAVSLILSSVVPAFRAVDLDEGSTARMARGTRISHLTNYLHLFTVNKSNTCFTRSLRFGFGGHLEYSLLVSYTY